MDETILLDSLAATEALAEKASREMSGGMTVGFSGDLGAGKTTFIRLLVKALGYGHAVSSPTYVLHHEYRVESGVIIDHWDLYRLSETPEELCTPCPVDHIRLIEWPEHGAALGAELNMHFTFSYVDEMAESTRRSVIISRPR